MQKYIEKGKWKKRSLRKKGCFKNKKRKEIRQIKIKKKIKELMEFRHKYVMQILL